MKGNLAHYYSGTSGLLLPVPNKLYYPEQFQQSSRLSYYGSLRNSIEINSSFYKIPMGVTVGKWAGHVSEHFRFSFKLFKQISHNKGLAFDPELVSRFFSVIANVGEKRGCLLVQFPPSVRISQLVQLRQLMAVLRENDPFFCWKIALEFRHVSLYCEQVYGLLEQYSMGMVLHDKAASVSPIRELSPDFLYLRFHGPGGNYRGSYDQDILYEYAGYIYQWLLQGKTVFAYFNNTMGDAQGNLSTLDDFVRHLA